MPNKTTNYNLVKPETNEYYDINIHNGNMDIIDSELKSLNEKVENVKVPVTSVNGETGDVELSASDILTTEEKTVEEKLNELSTQTAELTPKTDFNAHTANKTNPHSVTKAQVGLGSVQDYGIATQAESQAGTSNTKYMTPLRVKEAISALDNLSKYATITYAGDGAATRTITLGFPPRLLIIGAFASTSKTVRIQSIPGKYSFYLSSGAFDINTNSSVVSTSTGYTTPDNNTGYTYAVIALG